MIYLLCFGASVALAHFAGKAKSRKMFILLSLLSIVVPVALAGVRDYSIGIDTNGYLNLKRYWHGATSYDTLWEYLKFYVSIGYGEFLFAFILGSIAQTTGNFTVFLITMHAVIITGVYIGAFRQKEHADPAFILLLFYLLFYNHSLNVTRQYMAMAIVFAAFADIEKKKYTRYVIVVLISIFIHNSAVLGFVPLILYIIMYADFSKIIRGFTPSVKARGIFIATGLAVLVVFFSPLCRLLIKAGLLLEKYLFFLDNPEKIQPSTMISMFLLVELVAVFVFRKQIKEKSQLFDYLLICSVSYLILHQLSRSIVYGKRVAAYLSLINLTTIAMIPASLENGETVYCIGKFSVKVRYMKAIAYTAVTAVALFYWWYSYVLRNASETYPYKSILF